MTDQQLIDMLRTQKRDKAFTELYRHFPLIRNLIRTRGGDTADAEDVYQEALLVLYRRVTESDFKLSAKLSTYLFSVCRFLWKEELRRRNRMPEAGFEPELGQKEEETLQAMLEKEAEYKLAESVISSLGDRCRELLLLFYSGTLKLKDIAAKMGYSSENTAKNQKYKCLETAKNNLRALKKA